MKRKTGRPIKYSPKMCAQVIEMMSEGASKSEVAGFLNVNRDTISIWRKKYPEFDDAIGIGSSAAEAWWASIGKENLTNKNFNHRLWMIQMKNRFGWR